jgi:hypothetical protein
MPRPKSPANTRPSGDCPQKRRRARRLSCKIVQLTLALLSAKVQITERPYISERERNDDDAPPQLLLLRLLLLEEEVIVICAARKNKAFSGACTDHCAGSFFADRSKLRRK